MLVDDHLKLSQIETKQPPALIKLLINLYWAQIMEHGGMKDNRAYHLEQAKKEWLSAMDQTQESIPLRQWGAPFFSEVLADLSGDPAAETIMQGTSELIKWLESLPLTWPFACPRT
jgi:hypothetical protein